jgi:DNA-binding response OmpR family regulator
MKPTEDKPPKPKVLLVDDEPRICAALAGVLVSEGFGVAYVENGDEAIRAFRDGKFDIVLLDLRMPGKSGWETFGQLACSHPLLPVIIITALPDQNPTALAAGVGALLEKPLDIPVLLATMRRLLAEPIEARLARLAGRPPLPDPHNLPKAPPVPQAKGGEELP